MIEYATHLRYDAVIYSPGTYANCTAACGKHTIVSITITSYIYKGHYFANTPVLRSRCCPMSTTLECSRCNRQQWQRVRMVNFVCMQYGAPNTRHNLYQSIGDYARPPFENTLCVQYTFYVFIKVYVCMSLKIPHLRHNTHPCIKKRILLDIKVLCRALTKSAHFVLNAATVSEVRPTCHL